MPQTYTVNLKNPKDSPQEIVDKLNQLHSVLEPSLIKGGVVSVKDFEESNKKFDKIFSTKEDRVNYNTNAQGRKVLSDMRWHGGGGESSTPTLQQVTDTGATTTHAITVNGLTSNSNVTVNGKLTVTGPIDPTYIEFSQIATPSTPASAKDRLYFKSDNNLYSKNSSGTETQIGGTNGTVTSVATGTGLTGGTITTTGTVSLDSKLAPADSLIGNSLKFLRVNVGETAVEYASPSATAPGGSNGDIQINASSAFGTVGGMNVNQTGNSRGTGSLDIQSTRGAVTQVASGATSVALGSTNTASGDYSVALGTGNTVAGTTGIGIGISNTSSGIYSLTMGRSNTAICNPSIALGIGNSACNTASTASGYKNTASGYESNAFGFCNLASGCFSTAVGWLNTTSCCNAHAFGRCISNATAASAEIGPLNTEKLRISAAGANLITSSGTFMINGTVPYVPTSRTVNGKALSSNITLGLASSDFANQGTTTTVLHGNAAGNPAFGAVVEADVTLADNTTNNVSTTKHGFAPKSPNDATKYLDGSGAYSVPAGTSTTVTTLLPQPNFQTKYSSGATLTLSSNTSASVGQIVIPFTIVVNTVTFFSGTNTTPGLIKIGLYTENGQTQKFNKTSGTISATGLQTLTLASPTTITPGNYYFVVMSVGSTNLAINSFETANTSSGIKSIGSGAIMDGTLTVTADTLPTTFSPSADISAANNNTVTLRFE